MEGWPCVVVGILLVYNPATPYTTQAGKITTEGSTTRVVDEWESGDGEPSAAALTNDFMHMTKQLFWKVIVPVTLVCGLCVCLCTFCKKMCRGTGGNPTSPGASEIADSSHPAPAEPLMSSNERSTCRPYTSATTSAWHRSDGPRPVWNSADTAGPPPSYTDVVQTPSSTSQGVSGAGDRPGSHVSNDTTSSAPPPPPSFSARPNPNPPAYHDLFPNGS